MHPQNYPIDLPTLRGYWDRFVETTELPTEMDPRVRASWHRCLQTLSPRSRPRWESAESPLAFSEVNRNLKLVAAPFMEDIAELIEGSGSVIVLIDAAGTLLEKRGDSDVLELTDRLGFQQGAQVTEPMIGTTAFSLAFIEGIPIQVVGPEHYLKDFHTLYTAAAPLHDPSGRLIGVLGMVRKRSELFPQSLGIIFAATKAIENQYQADLFIADLESARSRAERDMRLAIHVQRSFYPREVPRSAGYDIALSFLPMSGVSGDLYDFYGTDGGFSGVGLFDVSGHGIASGLVAMLAKAMVHQDFLDGQASGLSQVMERFNQRLISQKGEIENYLTGILLRFDGSEVEYVNAAHPALLLRSGHDRSVSAVTFEEGENSGTILGMDVLSGSFPTRKFSLATEDCILLYTDGLVESRNPAGEAFGMERLMLAFHRGPGGSSQGVLDSILAELDTFLEGRPFNDDLTLIVVRKTPEPGERT